MLIEDKKNQIIVNLKYKDIEQSFSGSVESVWLCVNKFFGEFVSTFELADRLTLKVNLQKLLEDCRGIFAFSADGVNLLVPKAKLTDNETLSLLLLASYAGFQLSKLNDDALSRDELQAKLGKDPKIVSTRLGELVKNGIVAKTGDEKYRITTFGLVQMQREILSRIRARS